MIAAIRTALSHLGVRFMHAARRWPLPLLRAIGTALGALLWVLAWPRRRIALANLALCFAEVPLAQRRAWARAHFVGLAQAWLDRAWLWHAQPELVRERIRLTGDLAALRAAPRAVLLGPHVHGLDAAWTALAQQLQRPLSTIYMRQSNAVVDAWAQTGRQRWGDVRLHPRDEGVREIARGISQGRLLYLLPDLDYGALVSEFVPFFGVSAATVTSLSRFARLGQAQVFMLTTRITPQGYDIHISPAWPDYPTADAPADAQRMNAAIEAMVREVPHDYLWTHRRFKTTPPGDAGRYR